LSQLIIEAHGGSLSYEERNNHESGATFRISLPMESIH
jgi:K+-sensing histidine kinase KdpD